MSRDNKGIPLINMPQDFLVMPGIYDVIRFESPAEFKKYMDQSGLNNNSHALLALQDPRSKAGPPDNLYRTGIVVQVKPNPEHLAIKMTGLHRAEITHVFKLTRSGHPCANVQFKLVEDENFDSYFLEHHEELVIGLRVIERLIIRLMEEAEGIYYFDEEVLEDLISKLRTADTLDKEVIEEIVWSVAFNMPELSIEQRQAFIETSSLPERIGLCVRTLGINIRILLGIKNSYQSVSNKIKSRIQSAKKSTIGANGVSSDQASLDDESMKGSHPEILKRWRKYKSIKDPIDSEGKKALISAFEHLNVIGSPEASSADWSVNLNYVDVLLNIYSCITSPQETDIVKVENVLGASHYGMEKIKERIYNGITAKILNPRGKGPTPCFVGPPGVGKTSIGQSIADSLGRKFIRLSLGGVKDEAEIRGHRRTYIGAAPGKIIEQLRRSGVRNPVFMLDEIDKMGTDGRGDPAAALLEVLDPAQNHSFRDHYMDVPVDLSEILFLCTANLANNIPQPLMDRMEVISIAGYTEFEKIQIAKKFLVPEQIVETGFPSDKVKIIWPDNDPDKILSHLIGGHTSEAGVRGLKRELYRFLSAWNRRYLKIGDDQKPTELLITETLLDELLGLARERERANVVEVGEAIGLAWTEVGGEIMYIHAELTPHIRTEKDLSQTGNLGKVFQEANHNALTVVKNLLRGNESAMGKLKSDLLCLSVPDLGIEKDGPSAGISMATAIYSELTGEIGRPYLAMTGELTVKGRVRAIGGVKEKLLAAQRAGIKEVILPEHNKRDVEKDIPESIKKELTFHYVSRIEDVIAIVFPSRL